MLFIVELSVVFSVEKSMTLNSTNLDTLIQTSPQKGLAKFAQFFGNYLVQCIKKNYEWSKLFELFSVVNATSDMV